ncbi:MAG: hypothetical protein IKO44_00935 [Ruminococcus sp.]|nr:hypothetical protein [Ruminococcus sp.]
MPKSKGSMDSIQLPDKEQINSMRGGFVGSRRVYKEHGIDDFGGTVRASAEFSSAAPIKVPERTEPEKKDELDDFTAKPMPSPSSDGRKSHVKLGGRYIARWRFFKIAAIILVAIILVSTFLPPFMVSTGDGKVVRENIFENKGISAVKEELLKNENVYNIDNMTSEKAENYRRCTVDIRISNYTPFKTYIGGFSIVTCDPAYKDKLISVRPAKEDGYVIRPFSVQTVSAEILVCITELDDEKLTEALTSVVLRTTDTKKGLGGLPGMPIIPGFILVADNMEFRIDG